MSFNAAQKIVLATYGGGDHAHLETLDECRDAGDTLFAFLMIELADKEGCTDLDEAVRRVEVAVRDIEIVQRALENAL